MQGVTYSDETSNISIEDMLDRRYYNILEIAQNNFNENPKEFLDNTRDYPNFDIDILMKDESYKKIYKLTLDTINGEILYEKKKA